MSGDKLIKRYLSFSLGIWVRPLILFITTPVITWLLSPAEFGKSMMYSTFYTILQWIILLGTPNAFMRFFPQKSENEKPILLWSSMYFPLMLWILTTVILFIFKRSINTFLIGSEGSGIHVVLCLSLLVGILQSFSLNLVRMKGKGLVYSLLLIVESVSYSAFAIVFATFVNRTFLSLIYAQLFSNFLAFICGVIFERNYWFPIRIDIKNSLEIIKFSYPYTIIGLSWLLFGWTDRIVLRMFVSFSEIGLYSAAFKLVSVMNMFSSGFTTLWFPYAYERFEKRSKPENELVFARALDFVSFGMFLLGFLILALKDVIFLVFARDYRSAASVSPFLLLSPIMISLEVIIGRGIDFVKKTNWFVVIYLSATAVNVLGNFVLIPFVGAKGAAISTGLSAVFLFAFENVVSHKLYPINYNTRRVYVMVMVFVVIALVCTFFGAILSALFGLFGLAMTAFFYRRELEIILLKLKRYLGHTGNS